MCHNQITRLMATKKIDIMHTTVTWRCNFYCQQFPLDYRCQPVWTRRIITMMTMHCASQVPFNKCCISESCARIAYSRANEASWNSSLFVKSEADTRGDAEVSKHHAAINHNTHHASMSSPAEKLPCRLARTWIRSRSAKQLDKNASYLSWYLHSWKILDKSTAVVY